MVMLVITRFWSNSHRNHESVFSEIRRKFRFLFCTSCPKLKFIDRPISVYEVFGLTFFAKLESNIRFFFLIMIVIITCVGPVVQDTFQENLGASHCSATLQERQLALLCSNFPRAVKVKPALPPISVQLFTNLL